MTNFGTTKQILNLAHNPPFHKYAVISCTLIYFFDFGFVVVNKGINFYVELIFFFALISLVHVLLITLLIAYIHLVFLIVYK